MSDDVKPGYLRGRGSRGRGTTYHPASGDRTSQRPGRQNKGWRNPDSDSKRPQDSTTSGDQFGGNCALPTLALVQNCTSYNLVRGSMWSRLCLHVGNPTYNLSSLHVGKF